MERIIRLRRVALLCRHFVRNLAYHRVGIPLIKKSSSQFCVTAAGNFIDIAIMEWSKLFSDKSARHHWRNIVDDASKFEEALLTHLHMSPDEMELYEKTIKLYRDKFIAHLDDELVAEIPDLDIAYEAVNFLCRHMAESAPSIFPAELKPIYDRHVSEGEKAYECLKTTGLL
ncbi:hypothetical protein [Parvibaculum sp.]|uniref:hypothetical protein n=1 Tax=Parvibaculum sp. TaxID=2024848 RepID=UPI001D8FD1DD|nr:hypothetical protein [Parvibaculum sp.]MBX3490142.1 hypothetical protein [Parvibaculum sp.]MCW5725870.1 hypothetical protein [Parvibaculum sp.]